jgi:hypothetical protein
VNEVTAAICSESSSYMEWAAAGRVRSPLSLPKTSRIGEFACDPTFLRIEHRIGRTLIQLWLVYRFRHVFWLDATNQLTIEQSYKTTAAEIRGADDAQTGVDAAGAQLASLCKK